MKGLLKNHFFAICSNIKVFAGLMLALGIFTVAVVSPSLLIGYSLLAIVGFSMIANIGVKREFVSKWGRYKLTLPVKRADIIKSCFISQLLWLLAGILFAGACFFPFFYLGGEERSEVVMVVSLLCGIVIALGIISALNRYLQPGLTTILLGAAALVAGSALAFVLSYPLTVRIYAGREY